MPSWCGWSDFVSSVQTMGGPGLGDLELHFYTTDNFTINSLCLIYFLSGSARTQDPTNKNYAPELSTFGIIIEVSQTEVQWSSLSLGKPP